MKTDNEIKMQNRVRIIKYVLDQRHVSRQEIASRLGFSMPTVFSYVTELLDANILCEKGEFGSTGGRKAKALSICTGQRYVVGMDITKRHLRLMLMHFNGEPVAELYFKYRYENTDRYYNGLGVHLETFIQNHDIAPESVVGVGISIPGIIDPKTNVLQRSHILEVSNISLLTFSKYIPYPVYFENDANSAAYAEIPKNEKTNIIYLSLSNTVGGAIYLGSSLYTGDNYRGGEFGHIILHPGGKFCYCGKQGCLDAYCSAMVLLDHSDDRLEDFFSRLDSGDETCIKRCETYLDNLAMAVTNLRMAYDCNVILGGYMGGYIAQYPGCFFEKAETYNKFDQDTSYISMGKHKRQSTVIGIAQLMLNHYISHFAV